MNTAQNAVDKPTDFSFLDVRSFKEKYSTDQTKVCFYVAGVSCEKCVRKLEGLVETTPGLRRLRVELGRKLVHVEVDPAVLSFSKVANLIQSKGFEPIPIHQERDVHQLERQEEQSDLIRLAVAGACAGNIMTFSFAIYFGAEGSAFAWLSLLLYLPVVTFVAWPFYQGAWRSLLRKQISIDLPMTVASLAGFIFSTIELSRGHIENIYYDSISGFLFLILISRWFQRRLQRRFLNSNELLEGLKLDRVRIKNGDEWSWRLLDSVQTGEEFLVLESETVSADAELLSTTAQFSLAWLTGEIRPYTFVKGTRVPAGSRLISKSAQLKVDLPFADTMFGKTLDTVTKHSLSQNQLVSISDIWAQRLISIVFLIAVGFLAFYWHVSPEEAIRRSLALIVLACPCAMAFGTPLALSAALRQARKDGILVRDANLFSRTLSVQTIYFDKTGTLTDADLTLVNDSSTPQWQQRIILALENRSHHPIAFAFRKSFAQQIEPAQGDNLKEIAGYGVSGVFNNKLYEIRKLANQNDYLDFGSACGLFEDGTLINRFYFRAALKPDCKETIVELKRRGLKVALLSGDRGLSVHALGKSLGFDPTLVFAELTPEQKAEKVKSDGAAIMIGDGINDSLALMNASVGIAVSGGVGAALKSAGIYLTNSSLKGVIDFLDISKEGLSLVRQNLLISVLYNTLGGTLALMGFINPFVAALLMPISSGFILLSTWIRSPR